MDSKLIHSLLLALMVPAVVSHAGLIHHWMLDEDTAAVTAAVDAVGGLNGTAQGPASAAGKVGNAFSFDGSDDQVEIQGFTAPLQGTVALWINPALAKSKERFLGSGGDFEIWLRNNGELKNELFDNGSTTVGTGAGAVKRNEWYHVAFTYDNATAAVEIYLDGELKVAGKAQTPSVPTATTLLLGHRPGAAAGEHFKGLLDDIQIYDEVLAADQVKQLYEDPGSIVGVIRVTASSPTPADGANDVVAPLLQWKPSKTAVLHDVYVSTDPDLGPEDLAISRTPLALYFYDRGVTPGTTYYWRVDEIEADLTTVHVGEVWSFLARPLTAYLPTPADEATDVPTDPNAALSWLSGLNAAEHHVYFGNSFDGVSSAAVGADKGITKQTTFTPGTLDALATYFWRVDEIDALGNVQAGPVWSFTTYLTVEDFEGYNDDMESKTTVFDAWIDGWTNGTCATVGNLTPPFAERTIIHGGKQAMPMDYNNVTSPFYSETEHEFSAVQDWTAGGTDTLILHVRGRSSNAATPWYVGLTDSASHTGFVSHPDAEVARTPLWVRWTVPLSEFSAAGVNLARIKSMSIGLGDRNATAAGAAGRIYVDDIWLTKPAP